MSPDVIDGRFSDYILTFPLPPLVGRDWGEGATHPDIPLIADTPPLEQEVANRHTCRDPRTTSGATNAFGAAAESQHCDARRPRRLFRWRTWPFRRFSVVQV